MASILMEADESSIVLENPRIAGLESQILNSQEIIVRLNRELDSALHRITTLENVCSENQTDLHEKRSRIKQLNDEINEREEINERLIQELYEKDEKLKNLDDLIIQLKQHIKEEKQIDQYQFLFNEYGDLSLTDLQSQITFDRQLRQIILHDLNDETNSLNNSPKEILDKYHNTERLKFYNLLQKSLTTEDISNLIDSNDILFELLTNINNLNRLKDTFLHDSKQLQHIRSLLNLTNDNNDEFIKDLINKHECIEYLHKKIDNNYNFTDFELIKHILHNYFNFQQQKTQLKEYLNINIDNDNDINYSKLLIEHCTEAFHVEIELNEQLKNQLNQYINQTIERQKEIDEILLKFNNQSIDQDTNEVSQLNRIRSILQSFTNFRLALSDKLSVIDNNEIILQRIDELISKLKIMENAENIIENLQKQLNEAIYNEKQLQINIKQIADQFTPKIDDNEESNLIHIHQKCSVESQTINNDEFYLEINEKLRNLLNIKDENLIESIIKLKEEHERLVKKEDNIDKSIERIMNKLGLSSDSSSRTQIDEICVIFDKFYLEYCQLTSTDIETINLIEIFKHIQLFLIENNHLKNFIHQINYDKSLENFDYLSKLQIYSTKVNTLCQLICNDNVNIDQALVIYQKNIEKSNICIVDEGIKHLVNCSKPVSTIPEGLKFSEFKQQLLMCLSIDNEEQIFDRLNEIQQMNTNLKEKLQNNDDFTNTISEKNNKILEYEDTLEKLRAQRDRMLNKMKEMKINNETLTNQLKQVNQSLNEFHRKEIDYKNQIEQFDQQLRNANNQNQITLDECRTQQDLQETMKLEIESIKNQLETQKKLYENRCRQIINEKNQLDKTKNELIEQKQILEDENKKFQIIFHTIKDTLENVDDINSIVDTILKLRQDHMTLTSELNQHNKQIHIENEKLLLNIHQQQCTINEYIQTNIQLDKRLIDNEQQIINLKKEINDHIYQYQHLQNEYQLYKEDNQTKKNSQIAVINIEQSPPPLQPHLLAVQQAAESNNWMAIDIKDEEIPLTTTNKRNISLDSTINTPTALFSLLGELKSKLGITLTHRPRLSSVYFLYLCVVHLLTFYLLFIRHC